MNEFLGGGGVREEISRRRDVDAPEIFSVFVRKKWNTCGAVCQHSIQIEHIQIEHVQNSSERKKLSPAGSGPAGRNFRKTEEPPRAELPKVDQERKQLGLELEQKQQELARLKLKLDREELEKKVAGGQWFTGIARRAFSTRESGPNQSSDPKIPM